MVNENIYETGLISSDYATLEQAITAAVEAQQHVLDEFDEDFPYQGECYAKLQK